MRPSTLRSRASPGRRLRALAVDLRTRNLTPKLQLGAVLALATGLRLWHLNSVGFNSDEAVYSGQGAAIADAPELGDLFPVFRAHPLLVQTFLSLGWRLGLHTGFERLVSVVAGVITVFLVYELGRQLYGRRTGLIAALLLALMPYHVVVSRQVLLDGPMTMLRHAHAAPPGAVRPDRAARRGCTRAGAAMGLTFLAKETSIVLLLRDLRVPGAHAGAAGAAARPRHLDGRDGAGDRALPAEHLSSPGARARARATSPGSCSGVPTTTGSSTPRTCPRRSVRWCLPRR